MRAGLVDAASQPIVNYASDPRATTVRSNAELAGIVAVSNLNWFGSGGSGTHTPVLDPAAPHRTGGYIRKLWAVASTVDSTTGIRLSRSDAGGFPVRPGERLQVSCMFRTNRPGASVVMRAESRDAAGAPVGVTAQGAPVTYTVSEWAECRSGILIPAGAATVGLILHTLAGAAFQAGEWLDITAIMVDRSPSPRSYVDGDRGRWLGTRNASPSVGYPRP